MNKFKEIHREVSEKLKKVNEEVTRLKMKVEEKKIIEECLNAVVQSKIDECTRLEQGVVNLKGKLEKAKLYEDNFKTSSIKLDELIVG